jgi:hypothetical protein
VTAIHPGFFIGAWFDKAALPATFDALQPVAVVDCTTELPRKVAHVSAYLCVPMWDTSAPSDAQLDVAVDFVLKQRRAGKTVVGAILRSVVAYRCLYK